MYLLLSLLGQFVEESLSEFQGIGAGGLETMACYIEEADGRTCFVDLAGDGLPSGEGGGEGGREVDYRDCAEGGCGCGRGEA